MSKKIQFQSLYTEKKNKVKNVITQGYRMEWEAKCIREDKKQIKGKGFKVISRTVFLTGY